MSTCPDCGTTPSYRNCHLAYCERCCDKAGHGWEQMENLAREAAPQMVRALLQMEWPRNGEKNLYGRRFHECPSCLQTWESVELNEGHVPGCVLDAALTAAGFPDQVSRDEARRIMAEANK